MLKNILVAAAVIGTFASISTPSFALKGVQAMEQCVQNTTNGCSFMVDEDNGSITILAGTTMIHCASLNDDCEVLGKGVKPKRSAKDYVVPEGLTSSGSGSGDTGVPGTGSGGGQTFYQAATINLGGQIQ